MEKFSSIKDLIAEYLVKERELTESQYNYSGFKFGSYEVIQPIKYFSFKSDTANAGWIVKNFIDGTYEILPNVTVVHAFKKENSIGEYFGIKYCEADAPFNMSEDLVYRQLKSQRDKHTYLNDFDERLLSNMKMYKNNLSYFISLDNSQFNKSLEDIVNKFNFKEINTTKGYSNCLYILVFDKYNQYYIGSVKNTLSNRTQKHWNAIMDFGRFMWRGLEYSRINVDTFRMKDNTRIFVCTNPTEILNKFSNKNTKFLENTNTFGIYHYEQMSDLEKAERIVINSADIAFCLSDRVQINAKEHIIEEHIKNSPFCSFKE